MPFAVPTEPRRAEAICDTRGLRRASGSRHAPLRPLYRASSWFESSNRYHRFQSQYGTTITYCSDNKALQTNIFLSLTFIFFEWLRVSKYMLQNSYFRTMDLYSINGPRDRSTCSFGTNIFIFLYWNKMNGNKVDLGDFVALKHFVFDLILPFVQVSKSNYEMAEIKCPESLYQMSFW